ncbi:hypothetical protein V6L78_13085 [Pseudomonas canadensis]|uniref:hypothetical protein n=1 Tax=Pseudomonas canadensis TaxID=915099 RepID=UPI0030CCC09A
MADYSELKHLVDRVLTDRRFCGDENHKALADGVLALIAENENLAGCDKAYAEVWEKARGLQSEMDEIVAERDQLKAENEALRQDADRYQWLRDKSEAVHQFYLSVPLWFTGVRFRPQDADNAIDAMSKGEQP